VTWVTLLGDTNLTKRRHVDRVANGPRGLMASWVDTDDTKTKGNDIGRIQKACSVAS
jgi:hypothetical protein